MFVIVKLLHFTVLNDVSVHCCIDVEWAENYRNICCRRESLVNNIRAHVKKWLLKSRVQSPLEWKFWFHMFRKLSAGLRTLEYPWKFGTLVTFKVDASLIRTKRFDFSISLSISYKYNEHHEQCCEAFQANPLIAGQYQLLSKHLSN